MVDFNSESLINQPIKQINLFLVIELHYNVLESLELYKKQKYNNTVPVSLPALKSRIYLLYIRVRHSLTPILNDEIEPLIKTNDITEMLKGFDLMDKYLLEKKVTVFLDIRNYDTYKSWQEDEAKGL